jgi:DNA mismatch endonuclease (patch repair protein)
MTDRISKERRSANMRAVGSRNTRPEIRVRQIAHSLGYRFRLHERDLPGSPDIAFPGRQKAIFVHGCFWHRHNGCPRATVPQSNPGFWRKKLRRNAARDAKQLAAIKKRGWRALVVWQCEIKDEKRLRARLRRFLGR